MFLICCFPLLTSFFCGFLGRFFGRFGSSLLVSLGMFINFIFSFFFFFYSFFFKFFFFSVLASWFSIGSLDLFWGLSFDTLALIMFIVVNSISFVVHVFSTSYMFTDPHITRFLSYISFFSFFMLVLVTSDNLLQLFLGWEGVGLCSYLLIGFWYTRTNALSSALKALVINRISDFFFMFGISFSFWLFFSFDFSIILSLCTFFSKITFFKLRSLFMFDVISILCFLFLIGAMGKSAQIILHTWLPDAMEGPTPVSALIHAATMVTAGVFLIIKCSFLFEYSGLFVIFLLFIGSLTAFMSGTIGIIQFDIKRVIAYSTCSQLGYMLLACGFSTYDVSFFHLMNHAFFKALLFLCAGCVIHSINNEQDIRRMGGLLKMLPFTFFLFFTGTLALTGFTFLTGFFSKDFILEGLNFFFFFYNSSFSGSFVFFFLFVTTMLTSLYSFRLLFFVFFNFSFFLKKSFLFLHESGIVLLNSLIILFLGSIFIGFFFREFFLGVGSDFLNNVVFVYPLQNILFETELLPCFSKVFMFFFFNIFPLSFFFGSVFIFKNLKSFFGFFGFYPFTPSGFFLYFFFNSKWGFDIIFNKILNKHLFFFSYLYFYELFDKILLENFFGQRRLFSLSYTTVFILKNFFQNGSIFYYAFSFFLLFLFFTFSVF